MHTEKRLLVHPFFYLFYWGPYPPAPDITLLIPISLLIEAFLQTRLMPAGSVPPVKVSIGWASGTGLVCFGIAMSYDVILFFVF